MNYLTKDELLDLHAYVVTRYGGRLGIASQDRLIGAVDAPRQVLFETELYPDLPSKGTALLFLLLKNRPFLSNNEGTALMALLRFLDINGAKLRSDIGDAELLWLVRAVSYSDLDKIGIESWLRDTIVS
jgi:death-on-curing protein